MNISSAVAYNNARLAAVVEENAAVRVAMATGIYYRCHDNSILAYTTLAE